MTSARSSKPRPNLRRARRAPLSTRPACSPSAPRATRLGEANTTPAVTVTRAGGDTGAVTATITTNDGTAVAGSDYTPLHRTVHFADGDTTPRFVQLPILNDLEQSEPDETVTIALSDPGGCATLGPLDTTTLTIRDNDQPPVDDPTFTIGGTVTGLAGTGLVLSQLGERITPGNGPFEFAQVLPDGFPYRVTVTSQPAEPTQICTVTNGEGTVTGSNVTDVTVDCVTPPPDIELDPTFGDDGKVTTPGVDGGQAIVVQPDGKIVTAGNDTLARYNTDGTLDETFGGTGIITTDLDNDSCFVDGPNDVALAARRPHRRGRHCRRRRARRPELRRAALRHQRRCRHRLR